MEAGQTGLVDRRNVRRRCNPFLGGHRIDFDSTLADVGERDGRPGDHEIELPGDEVEQGWPGAAVGDELELGPGLCLEESRRHVGRAADAALPRLGRERDDEADRAGRIGLGNGRRSDARRTDAQGRTHGR